MSGEDRKVRYAVVGAGWFGQEAVLPAFHNARGNSELAAIISGDPTKREALSIHYGVPTLPYSDMESLFKSGEIDVAYIVTPNAEHAGPAIKAAECGVHVLCEKPLAKSAAIAEKIVEACERNGVGLMTAYRLHFEKANLTAVEHIRRGRIGEPRLLNATYTQTVAEDNVRLDPKQGGHPLLDLGIYCINAARYLFRAEPVEVIGYETGRRGSKDGGVPDLVTAILKFPHSRLAQISAGFGQAEVSHFRMTGTDGSLELNPAFSYAGERTLTMTVEGQKRVEHFPAVDQVAGEIEYFSERLLTGRVPEPDGTEGLLDMIIIDAILTSIREGHSVPLQPVEKRKRPSLRQERAKPPHKKPMLIHASPP
jgi:glucose-fructose oxidoreductase